MGASRPFFPIRFWQPRPAPALLGEADRLESAIAAARCLVVASSLALTFFESAVSGGSTLVRLLLIFYLAESLAVFLLLRHRQATSVFRFAAHGLDVAWAVLITLADEGSASIFFLLFVFVLLAAAFRWGLRETLWTSAVSALFLFVQKIFAVSVSGGGSEFWGGELGQERFLARLAILFVLGLVFGYFADKEKQLRVETSLAKAMDRALVARELHDGAIQSLIGLEVQVDVLRRQAAGQSLAGDLARIQDMLKHEVLSLRELMRQMKPVDLNPDQLLDFLAESADRFWRETGISTKFVSDLDEVPLAPAICQELARIAQEALVNIRKHSGARNVVVRFEFSDRCWRLIIDDDGHGFDFSGRMDQTELDASRKGPVIIKERVRAIGGELTIESTPGRGARLEITLPERRSGIRDRRADGEGPTGDPHSARRRSSDRTRRGP